MNTPLRLPPVAPRDRRALLVGAALVLPVIFTTLVVRPWIRAATVRRAAIERECTLLLRERELLASAPRDRERLTVALHALDQAAPRLFGGSEAVTASAELARYLSDLVAESGLTLDDAESVLDDPGAFAAPGARRRPRAPGDAFVRPLRVTIRAHGDAQSIVDFLRSVEHGERQVRIERVGITRSAGERSSAEATGALAFTATVTGLARASLLGAHGNMAEAIDSAPGAP